ncbi:PKD domain-containing protein [Methanosarcina sp.]|uniref:PKD domain-containing protein n=1 Tax=Methanosarcina sp. TaxID=2213 RepID=UPI003BB6987A
MKVYVNSIYVTSAGTKIAKISVDSSVQSLAPVANFYASPTSGKAPLAVQFYDTSTDSPTKWKWDLGDGTTSTDRVPSHTYTKEGTYTVTLTATNSGGSNTATKTNYIVVTGSTATQKPVAAFTASPTSGSKPLKVQFTDKSTNNPTSWKWDFGDGSATSTTHNPLHTYIKVGTHTVTLTATNAAGSNTVTKTNFVTVAGTATQKPVAAFSASPTSGSIPLKVQFTDQSTNSPTSWKWDFGDGSATSTTHNPLHTYIKVGTHKVTLTATNAAGSSTVTKTAYIKVTAPVKPVAAFTASPRSGAKPLKVQFTDKSTGNPTSWKWNFGDGTTSTTHNPLHTYIKKGKFNVVLTVKNAAGTSTKTMTSYVTVN